ncbi:MAG TPA: two-component system sensor histidine kinase CreC [Arenimonas sp.]|uniref:two-component system sensor histidine kinase CreC n=1 Tax=Arenimonas sp. TaxID=1872635 RepID=UPI002C5F59B7|nr:two-component system sensor histidine kinase CreC [Arenimonas sp.]HMB57104.1 two-component system sensor histidine kinase CreC [Arenimonas sp.]
MRIGLRIFLGYFLIVGLAGFFVMRVFVNEVKPGVRQAMEATLVDTSSALAALAAPELSDGTIADGRFSRAVDALEYRTLTANIAGVRKSRFDYRIYVTDAHGIVVYDSDHHDVGKDYSRWNDVYLTLRGKYGARSTRGDPDDEGSSVMHVAAPVLGSDGSIIGVLTVAKANRRTEPFIANSQWAILKQGWVLLGLSFLIGLAVTWWLSRSVDRLNRYATAVAAGERAALPAVGGGELGELGRSLETMREKLDGKQYVEGYVQTLAHEMKSPLAAIRGAAEILESDPPEADRRRFVRNIDSQSARLAQMIDKMLALAAVEYRQALENTEPLPLRELLDDAVESVTPRMLKKHVEIAIEAISTPLTVQGDRFLLRQAIANLLDNAVDFSPPGSTVRVKIMQEGNEAGIVIADNGPGIPDYAGERIFERFYSLPRPDGARSSGLGLSFVREVAALHGGSVALANRDEDGAEARFFLPAI